MDLDINQFIDAQINVLIKMQSFGDQYVPKIEMLKYLACLAVKGEVGKKDYANENLLDKFNNDMQECGLTITPGKVTKTVQDCLVRKFNDQNFPLPGYDFDAVNRLFINKAASVFMDKFKGNESINAARYLASLLIDGNANEVIISDKKLLAKFNDEASRQKIITNDKLVTKGTLDGLDDFFLGNDDSYLISRSKASILEEVRNTLKLEEKRNTRLKIEAFIERNGDDGISYLAVIAAKGEVRRDHIKDHQKYRKLYNEVEDMGLTTAGYASTPTQDKLRAFFMDNDSIKLREQFMNINKSVSQGRYPF